jgi:glycosyltransferase involved in cell wall biosynthesis
MRILFLTRFTRLGASSRYRCYQFSCALKERGHEVEFAPLLDDEYLRRLFSKRPRPLMRIMFAYLRRLYDVIRSGRYDLAVVQYEAFPWMPVFLERLLFFFNRNVVLDLDDAWHERYARNRLLRGKIPWLMRRSRAVVAGSEVIASFSRRFNERTVLVPTVVDVRKYVPNHQKSTRWAAEIVWVGSPVTAKLLLPHRKVWQSIGEAYPEVCFKFIGAGEQFRMEGVRYRVVPWLETTETEEVASADIGIMPLQDEPFQRGKCALKIIQYMAAGLPVVASPIGANNDVVQDGETGFLPASEEEWGKALSALIEDHALRRRMGSAGRKRAEQLYCIETAVPILEAVFSSAAELSEHTSRPVFEPKKSA